MRIISNYKDYYDSLQDYSDTIIWNRQYYSVIERDIEFKSIWKKIDLSYYYNKYSSKEKKNNYTHKIPVILGYCGNYFKYIIKLESFTDSSFIFSDDFFNIIINKETYDLLDVTLENDIKKYFYKSFYNLDISFLTSENLFNRYNSPLLLLCPLFLQEEKDKSLFRIFINPSLKKLGFSKKKNIQQVYQELDMFVSGVLTNKEDRPELSEKHRQGSRFDKYSFRRLPEK